MGSLADWCLVTGLPNVFLVTRSHQNVVFTHLSSPGSHGLSVIRRRDGRGSGQVSPPHTMPLTLAWAGGGGVLAASVAGAGVGLVALQHVLRIWCRGGEVLEI